MLSLYLCISFFLSFFGKILLLFVVVVVIVVVMDCL